MTADARQRIVGEWIDLKDTLTISVTVCSWQALLETHLYAVRAISTCGYCPWQSNTLLTMYNACWAQVGPASGILKDATPDTWTPKQVANQVLMDRCAKPRATCLVSEYAVTSGATDGFYSCQ